MDLLPDLCSFVVEFFLRLFCEAGFHSIQVLAALCRPCSGDRSRNYQQRGRLFFGFACLAILSGIVLICIRPADIFLGLLLFFLATVSFFIATSFGHAVQTEGDRTAGTRGDASERL